MQSSLCANSCSSCTNHLLSSCLNARQFSERTTPSDISVVRNAFLLLHHQLESNLTINLESSYVTHRMDEAELSKHQGKNCRDSGSSDVFNAISATDNPKKQFASETNINKSSTPSFEENNFSLDDAKRTAMEDILSTSHMIRSKSISVEVNSVPEVLIDESVQIFDTNPLGYKRYTSSTIARSKGPDVSKKGDKSFHFSNRNDGECVAEMHVKQNYSEDSQFSFINDVEARNSSLHKDSCLDYRQTPPKKCSMSKCIKTSETQKPISVSFLENEKNIESRAKRSLFKVPNESLQMNKKKTKSSSKAQANFDSSMNNKFKNLRTKLDTPMAPPISLYAPNSVKILQSASHLPDNPIDISKSWTTECNFLTPPVDYMQPNKVKPSGWLGSVSSPQVDKAVENFNNAVGCRDIIENESEAVQHQHPETKLENSANVDPMIRVVFTQSPMPLWARNSFPAYKSKEEDLFMQGRSESQDLIPPPPFFP